MKPNRWYRKRAGVFWLSMAVFLSGFAMASDPVDRLMDEANGLYQNRKNLDNAYLALEKYREVLTYKPDYYEALWKVSKTAFFIAEMHILKGKKWEVVEPGIKSAKLAIKVNPSGVDGYFWLGVLYTKVGEIKGILKSIFLIAPIKRAMRKVLEINEAYEGGGAYTVLGRVYSRIPGILGGSEKKARNYYRKARQICPANLLNLLFLAETYHELGEKQLALKTLDTLLSMEADNRWKAEAMKHKDEARKLLRKYKGNND
jgi:tetratricopeptide (TPR) repeat protein